MVAAEHAAIRERGEAVGLLHAAEYPIYGRFGYGPATRVATWTLDAHGAAFHDRRRGDVEVVAPDATTSGALQAVFESRRAASPGEIRRRDYRWAFELGRDSAWGDRWKGFVALHRDAAGTVDGYVRYHGKEKWVRNQPRSRLVVDDLQALNDAAYTDLWRFLAETDLVASVRAGHRSPSERLPWLLTNARAAIMSDLSDGLWVRLFDVPRALEARTYERAGTLVIDVVDGESTSPGQRYLLDAGPDGATCRTTDRSPDITIDVASLAAAYLGGARLRDTVVAYGCDEHVAGALARADALLQTTDEPWCSTLF
jgi:predicted acetyltransferase